MLHQLMTVELETLRALWLREEIYGGLRHHKEVQHQEMRILPFSLSSLGLSFLFGIQHFFYLFICQSSTCFGMAMIGRYDKLINPLSPLGLCSISLICDVW